ncbi:cytoplasmic dynein 1 light intermediate chain 2-like isoform X2 [Limulus polyphemus]|uniref:Dynein light intermediate chain n=1 Tax=Limulus polyphemus TaxID=6850 RepID=A0ABM1S4M6_LIMPO|nr:cytoplasmic dynein 1 light intermediate chain 2-like isoform X2 [Limulus polyphemus]
MARTGEKMTEPTQPNELKDEKEGISIWSTILSQVQASSPNKLPSCKLVLILGDDECGKTSLIAKLQGNEDPKKGSGLEYHYILVRDEYRDDHTQLGVWILDGDPWHRNLLKYVVNEVSFPHITVLLAASMTQPWNILESLEKWAMILEENLDRLKLDSDLVKEFKQKTLKRFQEYLEPRDEIENVTSLKKGSGSEEETISLPLDEITLTCNVGLDVIVVVTKTDFMSTLEKDYDYKDEHFDFIQQALRKFCLKFGASLVYTSVKEDKNCDLLYKYLVHKIYSFPFKTPALLVEKDSVFIKPVQREGEIAAEEDQTFLLKQQNLLNQQLSTSVRSQESSMRTPSGAEKTSDRRLSGTTTVQNSPRKIDGPDAVAGSEGVLQNFFNSLLNRKTGPGASSSSASLQSPEKVSVRNDAVAELDRMMRLKKPLAPNQSNNIDNLMNASPGDTGPSSSPQM